MQGISASNFNNTINVYQEQLRMVNSKQDISEITTAEMDDIFDGSLLNAEIIVGKGASISSQIYDRIK